MWVPEEVETHLWSLSFLLYYLFIFRTEDKYAVHLIIHPNRMNVHSVYAINDKCIISLLIKLSLSGLLRALRDIFCSKTFS